MKKLIEYLNDYDCIDLLPDILMYSLAQKNYYKVFRGYKRKFCQKIKEMICSRDMVGIKVVILAIIKNSNNLNKIIKDYSVNTEDVEMLKSIKFDLKCKNKLLNYKIPKYKTMQDIEKKVIEWVYSYTNSLINKKMRFVYNNYNWVSKEDLIMELVYNVLLEFYRIFIKMYNDTNKDSIYKYLNATINNYLQNMIQKYSSKKINDLGYIDEKGDNKKNIISITPELENSIGKDCMKDFFNKMAIESLLNSIKSDKKKIIVEILLERRMPKYLEKLCNSDHNIEKNYNIFCSKVFEYMGVNEDKSKKFFLSLKKYL